MKATAEIELKVSGGRILSAEVKDGVCRLLIEGMEEEIVPLDDNLFVRIEASKLSMDDEFMQYQPKTDSEKKFKNLLEAVIKHGVPDFWRPRIDPSLDKNGNICFKAGEQPAVRKSYNWWCDNAKKFNPGRKSRLGTKSQYIAFLGVLIKALIAEGWKADEAWNAVCNNSEKLGHYWNSVNAKHNFESTGSRVIAGFYDLANTSKILSENEDTGEFWLACSSFDYLSNRYPLTDFSHTYRGDIYLDRSVGWLVMD